MRARHRATGWGDGEEVTVDPKEDINFDQDLPSTISKRRRFPSTSDLENPLGEGKYRGTDLDFDEDLPDCRAVVQIAKAAREEDDPEKVPFRVHQGDKVETRVSTPSRFLPVVKEASRVDLPELAPVVRYNRALATATIPVEKKAIPEPTHDPIPVPTTGEAGVRIRQFETTVDSKEELLPSVLSWEAVRKGDMPEPGTSGLPESLEQDVPPKFRFWKCDDPFDARAVRDALVEEGLFATETVRKVNGELRRAVVETVRKFFLSPSYDPSEPVEVPPNVRPVEKVASLLEPLQGQRDMVLFDEQITDVLGIDTILEKAGGLVADWVVAARDSELVRKAIGGPAFKLKSRADLVFATNATIVRDDLIEWVQLERADEVLKFALSEGRTIPILKSKEERIVYGIVLEPDEVDSQKDTVSKEEIEQACHKFMEDFGGLGRQHQELVNGKLVLLENFIAPVDFEVDGQPVKAGSWLMKERVVDDQLWESVKKGKYTGFSIGGSAVRKPVK